MIFVGKLLWLVEIQQTAVNEVLVVEGLIVSWQTSFIQFVGIVAASSFNTECLI